jgi:succinate-semialdehyde dehydrogenase/glutarate-semialdehyde dehydrogenase
MIDNKTLLQDKLYINGEWIDAGASFDVTNPATGERVGQAADANEGHTQNAIDAADKALKPWSSLSAKARGTVLMRWHDLILENKDDLARLLTLEQGKPLPEAVGEIAYGASFIQWFAEEAKRAYGETIPSTIDGARMITIKQPIGVCAAITPWNFPNAMITRKVAPALAAGCTVIIKPAEDTPLSALALGVLAEQAGIPAGVLNIITTQNSKMAGEVLCASKTVRKLSFTGSTPVGKILMKQSADTLKKLSLELGGNAPFIVFEDADIDAAVDGAIACKFRNAGQTCVCANRFYVHGSVYDEFVQKFTAKAKALKIGNGLDDGVYIGPLINKKGADKAFSYIEDTVSKGGQVECGGTYSDAGALFIEPTVISNTSQDMKFSCEEIFGPIAPVFKFTDEADVIYQANASDYGLAGYFYTRDIGRAWRVAEALEFGIVSMNAPVFSTEVAPFGGIKESGFGKEGSKYGLDDYLITKYVLMGGV